jgi:hypothetical protein
MTRFKHDAEGGECTCVDEVANRRIFWMDPSAPGVVTAILTLKDVVSAKFEFSRHGVLIDGEPSEAGAIDAVVFECPLDRMIEKLVSSCEEPELQLRDWLLNLQRCTRLIGEALLEISSREGPAPVQLAGK